MSAIEHITDKFKNEGKDMHGKVINMMNNCMGTYLTLTAELNQRVTSLKSEIVVADNQMIKIQEEIEMMQNQLGKHGMKKTANDIGVQAINAFSELKMDHFGKVL